MTGLQEGCLCATYCGVVWVVGMTAALGVLLHVKGAAQQEPRAPMPPNLFTIHKLTDKLAIIAPSGPDMSNVGGNIGVFVTDEGVLVVDDNYYRQRRNGQTVEMAEGVVAEIRRLTNQPIRFVINTHHHGDHAGGNPVFAKFATIYAQKNVRNRLVSGYQNAAKNAPGAVAKAEQEAASAKSLQRSAANCPGARAVGRGPHEPAGGTVVRSGKGGAYRHLRR